MQFFEHQDQARGRTTLLIVLFGFAVLVLGLAAAGATHFALSYRRAPDEPLGTYHLQFVACAAIATWGVILLGSAYKMISLQGGGARVAEAMGGSLVANNGQSDLGLRRALNVVEEMAIAAGLPVPPLYILNHETGINAFAAGWSIDDAVIGVTRGAIDQLSRDQLQGVIAHEFSHILNRDCALNMRLLGILHGIVVISTIGRVVMSMSSGSRHSSTRREGGTFQIFIVGAGIWLFGSVGVLIARLIQASVSQQREYLADASAVQFTRNPAGLAGALARIGSQSSALSSPYASESSHMLISSPSTSGFSSMLSSHPPLFERIKRVVPTWKGDFAELAGHLPQKETRNRSPSETTNQGHELDELPFILDPTSSLESQAPHLAAAAHLLHSTETRLQDAARDPFSARALFALWLLDKSDQNRQRQIEHIRRNAPLHHELMRLQDAFWALPTHEHLPLFDLCMASLASLSPTQAQELSQLVRGLQGHLSADSYRAYCLGSLVLRHLKAEAPIKKKGQRMLVKTAVETTVAVLARQGHQDRNEAEAAFAQGCASLSKRGQMLEFPSDEQLSIHHLDTALSTLSGLPIATRKSLLNAAEVVARHDQIIEPSEAELLRVIAVSLDLATPLRPTGAPAFAPDSSL